MCAHAAIRTCDYNTAAAGGRILIYEIGSAETGVLAGGGEDIGVFVVPDATDV